MSRPSPSPLYTLRGAGSALNTLHFSCGDGDPPLLFSGSAKGAIHVWNLNTRRVEKVLDGHSGNSVIWLTTLGSRTRLISQSRGQGVCLWDLAEGRGDVVSSLVTSTVGFCGCSLLDTPTTTTTLLAHPGQHMEEVKVVELSSGTPVCSLMPDAKMGMVMCIKLWQPDSGAGPLLLAGYEDGSLLLWDVSQRAVLSSAPAHPEPVMCLTFDPAGSRGISGSAEKNLSSWRLDAAHNLQILEPVPLVNPGVSQLCLRGDSKIMASAGWDHRVRVFGWKKLRPLAVLQHHTDVVLSVDFSDRQDPGHRLLAAGSKDERISLWSLYDEASNTGCAMERFGR